ncbi:MAG: Flp family type IVb pilin [Rhodospirillales bacterium]|nr:Flp family type IVb pilin [Rhodospirillales bacterium]
MTPMLRQVALCGRALARDKQGATAIEYALIASLIAVVIIGAVTGLGGTVSDMFNDTSTALQ